jgi:hypothetical protein
MNEDSWIRTIGIFRSKNLEERGEGRQLQSHEIHNFTP